MVIEKILNQKILVRDFIIAFAAQFAFSCAYYVLIPTLPIFLSRSGCAETEIGVLIGAFSISSLVLRPFVGRALLRISEKKFAIAGSLLFLSGSIAYLVAPPFWPFMIARILQGIGLAFFYTATFTLIASISPEAHRGQSIGYFYMALNSAFAISPYFGMLLINRFNFTVLFLACTGLSLCSLLAVIQLRKTDNLLSQRLPAGHQPLLSREALPASIMCCVANSVWGSLTAFFPLYALSQKVTNPGLFFGTFALMLILGRGLGGKILDRYSREKVIFPCIVAYIVAMIILSFSRTLPMFIIVAGIWGIGFAFLFPALIAYALDLAGPAKGPAMGTFTAASDLGVGLGPVIMGVILRYTNFQIMFLCLALTGIINLSYFYFFVKNRSKIWLATS